MSFKIISEIGINHNGDFRLIEELIRQSAEGGADFAKFQLYDSEEYSETILVLRMNLHLIK